MDIPAEIQALAAPLFYLSESDAPWEIFLLDAAQAWPPQVQARHANATEVAEVTPEWLLRNQDQGHQALLTRLREALSPLCAFRAGEIEIAIFLVGQTADGQVMGLQSRAVET